MQMKFTVSPFEAQLIHAAADERNISASAYCRQLVVSAAKRRLTEIKPIPEVAHNGPNMGPSVVAQAPRKVSPPDQRGLPIAPNPMLDPEGYEIWLDKHGVET